MQRKVLEQEAVVESHTQRLQGLANLVTSPGPAPRVPNLNRSGPRQAGRYRMAAFAALATAAVTAGQTVGALASMTCNLCTRLCEGQQKLAQHYDSQVCRGLSDTRTGLPRAMWPVWSPAWILGVDIK